MKQLRSKIISGFLVFFLFFLQTVSEGQATQNRVMPATNVPSSRIAPQQKKEVMLASPAMQNKTPALNDTANSKITDLVLYMSYSTSFTDDQNEIINHYKPGIDLYDENNRQVAEWNYAMGIQSQQNGAVKTTYNIVLKLKPDNNSILYSSFKNGGKLRFRVENFFNQITGGGDDVFIISDLSLICTFQGPNSGVNLHTNNLNRTLDLKHNTINFDFSFDSPYTQKYPNQNMSVSLTPELSK